MSHAEITLKSGVTLNIDVSDITTTKDQDGRFTKLEWDTSGPRRLVSVSLSEVAAVVFVADEPEDV